MEIVGIVINKIEKGEGFHDVIILLQRDILKMLTVDKKPREEAILFFGNFKLIIVFVFELEVDHLVEFIGIIDCQKILNSK